MLEAIGKWIRKKIRQFAYALGFFYLIIKESFFFIFSKKQVGANVLRMQIFFSGVKALSIISFVSLALGAIIIIQGVTILPRFGQGSLIYQILTIVITRELGPILTAFIVIARSGTAIATELGNMVVNHQIEAYVAIGIKPISYLVVPRFLGMVIAMILLTVYFNVVGLVASFFVTQFVKTIPIEEYFSNLLSVLTVGDIVTSLVKSISFGVIISAIATYHAFQVKISSTEVPVVVIKAVGQGFVLCIIANVLITLIYYMSG